uniref:Uncharacterized protein n=1 Tax=Strombidinopsis acuminata TaxID=141414 RepID=A0A7S3WI06_9SPIT|mmetsp:Transcript_86656/g.223198  ORF Transcript_86656/g.223198 Transcript_86656/m.223198 type:complete len:187 (-) Transcript_86656:251-811(-)
MGRRSVSHCTVRRIACMGCALRCGEQRACAELARCASTLDVASRGLTSALWHRGDATKADANAVIHKGSISAGKAFSSADHEARTGKGPLRLGPHLKGPDASQRIRSAPKPTDGQKRVRFDLDKNTVHAVLPYAEVYGLHPREFVFEKGGFFVVPICRPPDMHEVDELELSDQESLIDEDEWVLVG